MATGERGGRERERARERDREREEPPVGVHVSLSAPRPLGERAPNQYVETPLRHNNNNNNNNEGGGLGGGGGGGGGGRGAGLRGGPGGGGYKRGVGGGGGGFEEAICRQPASGKSALGGGGVEGEGGRRLPLPLSSCSIVCGECGKCRCEACRGPRSPPSLWLCGDFCLCSLESCVDYLSCLCCLKGLAYHCSSTRGDADAEDGVEDPCSCGGPPRRLLSRWSCLALASLALPCLCCYPPLRSCAKGLERAYAAFSDRGCTCRPPAAPVVGVQPTTRHRFS